MANPVAVKKLTARDVIGECNKLKDFWDARNKKIKDWYNILLMEDKFKEADLESFVTNDPRTFYNMSMHLLCDKIPHRIPIMDIDPLNADGAATVERMVEKVWKDIDASYRNRGKQNFLHNFVGLLVATGWYSVFAYVDNNGFYAEVWNSIEVYPEWDEMGLIKVARVYTMKKEAAQRFVADPNLPIKYPKLITTDLVLYNYWFIDVDGSINNTIVLGEDFVKEPTPGNFGRIPIFTGPVGGLPDTGVILEDDTWKEHIGESILATNEYVYNSYNKQWTFSSQLLRDTAQPRWFEKSTTGDILTPKDLFKRGAIFKGGLQDSIQALEVPQMPIELRTDRYDMQGMLQRGGLPWSMSGDIHNDMSGYLMAQVASSAMETLGPYHDAIKNCLADIDNFWLSEIATHGYNPQQIKKLKILPEFVMTADYSMKIPGDLVQRATVAKMLNPEYTMATSTIMDLLFPEIKNPVREQALARADRAMNSPMSIQISTITAYRQTALQLKSSGDNIQSDLYNKAADYLEQQLFPQQPTEPTVPTAPQLPTGVPPMTALQQYGKKPIPAAMPRQAMNNPVGQQGM
jgi:hypothetical protein